MFAHLKGFVEVIGASHLVIDVNGVGYAVFASRKSLDRVMQGQEVKFFIETHVREDHIHLYGFFDSIEQEWFNLLTTVQGVGARVCLAILSALSPDQMTQAIMAQDKTAFTQADGVGPKLAGRIVNELKDKVAKLPARAAGLGAGDQDAASELKIEVEVQTMMDDALSALVHLGFKKYDAYGVLNHIQQTQAPASVNEFIRLGLKELSSA